MYGIICMIREFYNMLLIISIALCCRGHPNALSYHTYVPMYEYEYGYGYGYEYAPYHTRGAVVRERREGVEC